MGGLRYLIIGGDDRFVELATIFKSMGDNISTYGMNMIEIKGVPNYLSLDTALDNSDIIICPVPFAKEVQKINSKYSSTDIKIEELFKKLEKSKKLILGAINNYSRDLAAKYGIEYSDYFEDENYQVLNAVSTAEGVLSIIISETKDTIYGTKMLILGYGRTGKLISEYLEILKAEVYVEARKESDLAWIGARGMKAIPIGELPLYLREMQVIVNTVPAMILDHSMLDLVNSDVLILDIASVPGGVDFAYAGKKGIRTKHALGIPGKTASRSAAQYIYVAIQKILRAI